MAKHPVKVQNGGRVSIPAEVREDMDIDQGDYVVITVEEFDNE